MLYIEWTDSRWTSLLFAIFVFQICDILQLTPAPLNQFYPKLKNKLRSWKAQGLWNKLDKRASQKEYSKVEEIFLLCFLSAANGSSKAMAEFYTTAWIFFYLVHLLSAIICWNTDYCVGPFNISLARLLGAKLRKHESVDYRGWTCRPSISHRSSVTRRQGNFNLRNA